MMRATTRRCPGPESIIDREASAGSSWEDGKSCVAGNTIPLHYCCFYSVIMWSSVHDDSEKSPSGFMLLDLSLVSVLVCLGEKLLSASYWLL